MAKCKNPPPPPDPAPDDANPGGQDAHIEDGDIVVWAAPRTARIRLDSLPADSPDYAMMRQLFFDFQRDNENGFFFFSNMLTMKAIVSEEGDKPKTIMALRVNPRGGYLLGINFNLFRRLTSAAQKQLLKQQILRIPYGHLGGRTKALIQRYGQQLVEMASRVVLSQVIDPGILAENGIIMPVPEMWDLPRNLTLEQYCDLLFNKSDKVDGIPRPVRFIIKKGKNGQDGDAAKAGSKLTDEELKQLLKDLADQLGFTHIDDLDATALGNDSELDNHARDIIARVDAQLRNNNSDLKKQGWMAGDALEYIESLFREPKVPWTRFVRNFANAHLSRRTELDKRRASIRDPRIRDRFGKVHKLFSGRKHVTQGVLLWITDTSGSMGKRELQCVNPELQAIARICTVYDMQVDAGVAKDPVLFLPTSTLQEFHGRGGTSFKPGFEAAAVMRPKPSMIVYYTDGYGDAPSEKPDVPVLWCLTSTGMKEDEFRKNVANWGEICIVDVSED